MREIDHNGILKSVFTIGAGQLGLLLSKSAKQLGIPFEYRAAPESWAWLESVNDPTAVIVTFEQEHVDELLLLEIQKKGIESFPSWSSFSLLRDKLRQKQFLTSHQLPTASFAAAGEIEPFLQKHGEAILKAGRGGYDGQGVWKLSADGQAVGLKGTTTLSTLLPSLKSAYVEEKINFDYEIASVVCRSKTGEIVVYPTVKTIQQNGICIEVEFSTQFANSMIAQLAQSLAKSIVEKLDYVGVLAIEFFVKGEQIFVNEIAPRVHNSGHFTIDVCQGSQFENHLRAGLGWPLAATTPSHPCAIMVNLLWPTKETEFAPLYTKLTCGLPWPENVKLHWYGKSDPRPLRKMGHFTVYGTNLEQCRAQAQQILAQRWA
jgi:5-(carboxyamino)imidazole ribonucleotide synthase